MPPELREQQMPGPLKGTSCVEAAVPRAAQPQVREPVLEPQEPSAGRAWGGGGCSQGMTPVLRPLHSPKMRPPVPRPLFLPPSHTRADSISPYWGELEGQTEGTANATGPAPEAPPAAAPCRLPPGLLGASSSYHSPANPGRSGCRGNWDHQSLKRQPRDLTNPRLMILPFS